MRSIAKIIRCNLHSELLSSAYLLFSL